MKTQDYQVKLDDIFEGPMDLLVHLVKKHELDIYDIPIAFIIDQYLAYLELMEALNIDVAGDFVLMAATLAQIKSKMLLPVHQNDEEEDPRLEISRPLSEYLRIKEAAERLAARDLLGEDIFARRPVPDELAFGREDEIIQVGLFELIDAFQNILERISPEERFHITSDSVTVKDRISQLVDVFEVKGSVSFDELFPTGTAKSDVIVTFLAILEMVKLSLVSIFQHVPTGAIRLVYL